MFSIKSRLAQPTNPTIHPCHPSPRLEEKKNPREHHALPSVAHILLPHDLSPPPPPPPASCLSLLRSLPLRLRLAIPRPRLPTLLSLALPGKNGNDGGGGNNSGGGGDDETGDGGGEWGGHRGDALFVLPQAGRKLSSLPADLAVAVEGGRVTGDIVRRFAEMERSPLLRWLLGFRWFRERLLADDLFLAKLAMEMGVGMIAKSAPTLPPTIPSPAAVSPWTTEQSLDRGGAVGLRREDQEGGWSCGDGHTEGAGSMPERHSVCSGAAVQSYLRAGIFGIGGNIS
ncbi:protein RETICULATA-RELATED 4, chloroplastic [Triticum aestivum]|uniref:protein RETICULATA-RELATED 4, chloroplastic n=1 Tax=Triticum aestivum TaxID=4565 RepID=UPI001D005AC1|nr:protein RETICULATA-RELATED 4, chloroplastic-like [Triticum aestivum]